MGDIRAEHTHLRKMRGWRLRTKLRLVAMGMVLLTIAGAWLYWQHNVEWAARVAWGEARGEPDDGMQAVLNVMMNRKSDPRFPGTLSGVAKQAWQFTAYNEGDPNREKLLAVTDDDPEFRRAKRLAAFAQLGLLWDVTDGATYFHARDITRPDYLADAEISAEIGNHIFYVAD